MSAKGERTRIIHRNAVKAATSHIVTVFKLYIEFHLFGDNKKRPNCGKSFRAQKSWHRGSLLFFRDISSSI